MFASFTSFERFCFQNWMKKPANGR